MYKVTGFLTVAALITLLTTLSLARDVSQEERNRQLVLTFYDGVFNKHQVEKYASVVSDDYRQHNPEFPDGKSSFVDFFTDFFKDNPQSKVSILRSVANDDLVWLHLHTTNGLNDSGQAVVEIFRVKNGKIVEHWDVIQKVPEKARNKNTMF
jgi:predicted SnoaL-like aldol condensation-catalyzing enzyme